jgi:phenylalanine-4-hydroxylase
MLMNPAIADFIQAYGVGGLRAQQLGKLANLARVYWYTVEFGLVNQADGLRIYGAGIASSYSESIFALDDVSPNRITFDLARVMQTDYRIDDFQESYFVINKLDDLLGLANIDFAPLYELIEDKPDIAPGQLLTQDVLFNRGTGKYHTKA